MSEMCGLKGCHPNENSMMESLGILLRRERKTIIFAISKSNLYRKVDKGIFCKYTTFLGGIIIIIKKKKTCNS